MESNQIKALVSKYNEGLTDPSEVSQLEKLIEEGRVALSELHPLAQLDDRILKMSEATPSLNLDDKFYAALASEKKAHKKTFFLNWKELVRWNSQTAFAFSLLIVGLIVGYSITYLQPHSEISELKKELTDMKELMMLTLLQKESATERLKAVNLTQDFDHVSKKITNALIETLNHDPSVNVRLATLEALKIYAKNPEIRVQLVQSIRTQDSPLVQVALAELMVELKEKSSVNELRKIVEEQSTPNEVKEKIRESIEVLI